MLGHIVDNACITEIQMAWQQELASSQIPGHHTKMMVVPRLTCRSGRFYLTTEGPWSDVIGVSSYVSVQIPT
eukprot:scaffold217_cov99-Cylindrotheca_fusiformis.AAC.4